MSLLDRPLIAVVLLSALWCAASRHPVPLHSRASRSPRRRWPDGAPTPEHTQGRDRLFAGLRAGGSAVTVRGSVHMSFSDAPSYSSPAGRDLSGSTEGAVALADMARTTADAITAFAAFAALALGIPSSPTLAHVVARHAALNADHVVFPRDV